MNTPRVELSIPGLSGQALLDSLMAMFHLRTDRFSILAAGQEDTLRRATVEDRWGDEPQWPISLETIEGKLMGSVAGAFDPDIGSKIYEEAVRHTIFVWLSLLTAEGEADAHLRRVIP